jgi:membrane fusion protein
MSSLFRPEALANKSNNLFGKAYLSIPMSYSIYTLVLFIITVIILIGVYYGNYARKETVKGVLVPTKGLIRIVASRHGQVSQLPITTNAQVEKEDTLLRLTSLTHLTTGESALNQQAELLQNQIKALIKQENIEKKLFIANKQKQQEAN